MKGLRAVRTRCERVRVFQLPRPRGTRVAPRTLLLVGTRKTTFFFLSTRSIPLSNWIRIPVHCVFAYYTIIREWYYSLCDDGGEKREKYDSYCSIVLRARAHTHTPRTAVMWHIHTYIQSCIRLYIHSAAQIII